MKNETLSVNKPDSVNETDPKIFQEIVEMRKEALGLVDKKKSDPKVRAERPAFKLLANVPGDHWAAKLLMELK